MIPNYFLPTLAQIESGEMTSQEVRDVQQTDNEATQLAVDAGYMRLAHKLVHPDSFEAIPTLIFPARKGVASVPGSF